MAPWSADSPIFILGPCKIKDSQDQTSSTVIINHPIVNAPLAVLVKWQVWVMRPFAQISACMIQIVRVF